MSSQLSTFAVAGGRERLNTKMRRQVRVVVLRFQIIRRPASIVHPERREDHSDIGGGFGGGSALRSDSVYARIFTKLARGAARLAL